MSERFHLEGMGLMGSLIAHWLFAKGFDFTWHDTDSPNVAWKASAGVIYPSGEDDDYQCWQRWAALYFANVPDAFGRILKPYMERGQWCHTTDQPPYSGKKHIGRRLTVGVIHVTDHETLHLNVQEFVKSTRALFAEKRIDRRRYAAGQYIVTHGFHTKTQGSWSWGWSARAGIEFTNAKLWEYGAIRPALYLSEGYVLDYAYPIPGEPFWYLGTALVTQKSTPKSMDIAPKLDAYLDRMKVKGKGVFKIDAHSIHNVCEGWRPMPQADVPLLSKRGGEILVRPQYGHGVRHWWLVADALTKEFGL